MNEARSLDCDSEESVEGDLLQEGQGGEEWFVWTAVAGVVSQTAAGVVSQTAVAPIRKVERVSGVDKTTEPVCCPCWWWWSETVLVA